jgi:hypothetical protein
MPALRPKLWTARQARTPRPATSAERTSQTSNVASPDQRAPSRTSRMFRSRRGRRSARPSQRSVKPGRPTVAFAPQYRTSRRDLSRLHALDQKVVGPTEARFRKCPIGPRLGAQDDFSPGFWLRAVGAGCSDVRLGSKADTAFWPQTGHCRHGSQADHPNVSYGWLAGIGLASASGPRPDRSETTRLPAGGGDWPPTESSQKPWPAGNSAPTRTCGTGWPRRA